MTEEIWTVGFHAVLGLLESERPVDSLLLLKDRRGDRMQRIIRAAHRRGIRFDLVPRARLDRVAGGVPHNGCAARGAPVAFSSLSDIIRESDQAGRVLLVDDVSDPHNLGAVVRTSVALSIDGVVIAGPSAPPLGGALAKAAAGLLGRVPIVRERVAADALQQLRREGYWVFGAESGGTPILEVSRIKRWVLCLGAEEKGLRAKTRSQVDEFIGIPMASGVDSLNLSVSAGILLWELSRPPSESHVGQGPPRLSEN